MADFSTEAELSIVVDESSLREARKKVEKEMAGAGSLKLDMQTDGGLASGGAGGGRGGGTLRDISRDTRTLANLADDRNAILRDMLDELQRGGAGAGGGGGGIGGLGFFGDVELPDIETGGLGGGDDDDGQTLKDLDKDVTNKDVDRSVKKIDKDVTNKDVDITINKGGDDDGGGGRSSGDGDDDDSRGGSGLVDEIVDKAPKVIPPGGFGSVAGGIGRLGGLAIGTALTTTLAKPGLRTVEEGEIKRRRENPGPLFKLGKGFSNFESFEQGEGAAAAENPGPVFRLFEMATGTDFGNMVTGGRSPASAGAPSTTAGPNDLLRERAKPSAGPPTAGGDVSANDRLRVTVNVNNNVSVDASRLDAVRRRLEKETSKKAADRAVKKIERKLNTGVR